MAKPFDEAHLLAVNRELTQRIYELHNIFRISLELTSILDRKKLQFTFLVNVLGLLRATGAILFLQSENDHGTLTPTIARGFGDFDKDEMKIPIPAEKLRTNPTSHTVWHLDEPEAKALLGDVLEKAAKIGIELVAPLINVGQTIGLVLIGKKVTSEAYLLSDLELLALVNNFFATVLANVKLVEELEKLSTTDALTQLANRRVFDKSLELEVARSARYNLHFSLVMLDIDHFKHYNDSNGHPAGDKLLQQFAALLADGVRSTDLVARYGGEEFALIMVGVDTKGAVALCKRLQKALAGFPFLNGHNQPLGFVSASFGIASFPAHAIRTGELLQQADSALYFAKQAGRNKIAVRSDAVFAAANASFSIF